MRKRKQNAQDRCEQWARDESAKLFGGASVVVECIELKAEGGYSEWQARAVACPVGKRRKILHRSFYAEKPYYAWLDLEGTLTRAT